MYECRERVREAATRERQHAEARTVLAAQVCSGMITPPIVRDPLLAGWLQSNVMNNARLLLLGFGIKMCCLCRVLMFCFDGWDC